MNHNNKRPLPGPSRAGPPPTPQNERRQSEVSDSQGQGPRKKKRVSLSCNQCAKRKQKCNREVPCQHCLARKVPELCVPYVRGPTPPPFAPADPSMTARLDKMEQVLGVVVSHTPSISGLGVIREFIASTPGYEPEMTPDSPYMTPRAAELLSRPQTPKRLAVDSDHGRMSGSAEEDDGGIGKGWLGSFDGNAVPETMKGSRSVALTLDVHGTPAENLQRLIQDCGVSPHKVQELVQELPPKPFADMLVNFFFEKINFVRYPIDETHFRQAFEDIYQKSAAVDPSNVRALPLIFIVLATAVRLAPQEWAGDDKTKKLSSLRMYWSSRRSILIATAVQSESLELVVTRLLSALYLALIHDRRLTECWSQLGASLRTAQAIGLHRDGTKLGLDSYQTEYRRRLWSYLYHADRTYSLILGRPPSISDAYTDVLPPSNVKLDEIDPAVVPIPKPMTEPTLATYLILRKRLANIVGHIVHHFQKLHEPAQYADVEGLHAELQQFIAELPPHYRMHDADRSLDDTSPYLQTHRFHILSEILVVTIILHRPWLLRRLKSDRYKLSRTACFESAKLEFKIRQQFKRERPDHHISVRNQFREFNAAMIAGISAIIYPRGPDADEMRHILSTFIEQHPMQHASEWDQTTQKEVSIIHTLSRRATLIANDSKGARLPDGIDQSNVDLLLGLRREGDPGSNAETFNRGTESGPLSMTSPPTHTTPLSAARATASASGQNGALQLPLPNQWSRLLSPAAGGPLQSSTSGQPTDSPTSSSHEEDHSQRLLDHWLSANTSLAVGTDATLVEPSVGVSNAPPPSQWGGAYGPVGYDDPAFQQYLPSEGVAGPLAQENSDAYWNSLIDGILGSSGGSS